jgi:hypothetical protein
MAERRKPTDRTLLAVAAWGTVTTTAAYLISGGSIAIFIAVVLAVGIAQRVAAVHLARRRGQHPPRWWRI